MGRVASALKALSFFSLTQQIFSFCLTFSFSFSTFIPRANNQDDRMMYILLPLYYSFLLCLQSRHNNDGFRVSLEIILKMCFIHSVRDRMMLVHDDDDFAAMLIGVPLIHAPTVSFSLCSLVCAFPLLVCLLIMRMYTNQVCDLCTFREHSFSLLPDSSMEHDVTITAE